MSAKTIPAYTNEEHSLLDRFRLNSKGMGKISFHIFTRAHPWYELKGQDDTFIFTTKERMKLGKKRGVISKPEEVEFLRQINAYVDTFYEEARKCGKRDISQTFDVALGIWKHRYPGKRHPPVGVEPDGCASDDPKEIRDRVRKAFLQYFILLTHFHDKTLAYARDSKEDFERIYYLHKKLWKMEWLPGWIGSHEFLGKPPSIIYDHTYANSLSVSEIATIVSLITLITPNMTYDPLVENDWKDDWGYFTHGYFLRAYLYHRCGLQLPTDTSHFKHNIQDESLICSLKENQWDRFRDVETILEKIFYYVADTGVWNPDYEEGLKVLEESCQVRDYMDGWWQDEELLTTTGTRKCDVVCRSFCITIYPTRNEREYEKHKEIVASLKVDIARS